MRVPSWEGDWTARLAARLKARGFSTVAAFADSRPAATQKELADELGCDVDAGNGVMVKDLAPIQIVWALLDEAKEARTLEARARDLFVRELDLPDGWPPPRGETAPEKRKPLVRALGSWAGDIGRITEYQKVAQNFADALLIDRSIPVGWLPSTVDDPLLVELFRQHWREPSDEKHSTADPR